MMLSSSAMIRRFCYFTAASSSPSISTSAVKSISKKNRLVFLGSPQVCVPVLDALFDASAVPDSSFEVTAIVTQPPSGRDRGRKVMPSPVAQHALDRGFASDLIFTPVKAGEEPFLSNLKSLEPELCVTAAYGNILPTKFLNIPSKGTVNVHPSLLPLYRGAAPVQRTLQDGVKETGVSLAYTVRQLDAGPVIACEKVEIDDKIKAPELLELLFALGSKLLIQELPSIFDGSARVKAQAQDDSMATLAPKISPDESWLSFDEEAIVLHNKVRAFAGWPGTRARLVVVDFKSIIELKIVTTRVYSSRITQDGEADDLFFSKGSLIVPCGGGTALEVLEVQLPGKKSGKCNCILEWFTRPKTEKSAITEQLMHLIKMHIKATGTCNKLKSCKGNDTDLFDQVCDALLQNEFWEVSDVETFLKLGNITPESFYAL